MRLVEQRGDAVPPFQAEAVQFWAQRAIEAFVTQHGFVDFKKSVEESALSDEGDFLDGGTPYIKGKILLVT